jgi:hypothetical protein
MSTPDLMPILSAGSHNDPTSGACIMEMASFLAGEAWSDSPACTHPVLASMARQVNDRLPDDRRGELLPLLGRLMGTAPTGTEHEQHVLSTRLGCWSARQVLDLVRPQDRDVCERAILTAEAWCEGGATVAEVRKAANDAAFAGPAAGAASYAAHAGYAASYDAAAYAAANAAYAAADAAAEAADRLIGLLTGLLDEHDRLTGRTQPRTIAADETRALAALTR